MSRMDILRKRQGKERKSFCNTGAAKGGPRVLRSLRQSDLL